MLYDVKKKLHISKVLTNDSSVFWNLVLDKGTLKSFISWFLENYGEKKTLQILEELKNLGFGYATKAGISLGIEDLKIPPKKIKLLANSERLFTEAQIAYRRGSITGIEKMQLFIETWTETSEILKDEVVSYFEKTDVLNPVYMMAFSGARGNMSQVRQLVGMRGLMSDPQGKIIDFPIQSNFREGLTLTEYLISTYGARKGIVDTALRTATAGYLTRRLVDVAQHVVVSKFDCETKRGIFLFDMKEGIKTIYSFQNRLMGRVLAQDIFEKITLDSPVDNDLSPSKNFKTSVIQIASRNQEINSLLASKISKITKKALVRSPLTCQTRKLVCQLCYGWSLATSKLVAIGEAVGVIAGQSIGEPGTQLTMRTFHTGGVFSSTITEQINSPFDALIEYSDPIAGTCVRTSQGDLAFLTKSSGTLFCKKSDNNTISSVMYTYKIPAFTLLFARHGQFVKKEDLLAQVSAFPVSQKSTQIIEQTIYSSFEGEVYYRQLELLNEVEEKYGERTSKSENWAQVWVLAAKILKTSLPSNFFPYFGDYISKNSVINQIEWILPPSTSHEMTLKNKSFKKLKQSIYTEKYIKNNSPALFSQKTSSTIFQTYFRNRQILKSNIQNKYFKNSFQILSNCKLRENFFVTPDLLFQKNDYETLLIPNFLINFKKPVFSIFPKRLQKSSTLFDQLNKKSFLVYKIKTKKTEFNYPYQRTTRFYLTKFLTKTTVTLPLLNPGILKTWLSFRRNKTTLFSSVKKKSLDRSFKIIKNLTLNQKFKTLSKLKQNFFYPLIFSNTIPSYLKSQTLKTYLYSKKLDKNFQTELLKKSLLQKLGKQPQSLSLFNTLHLKGDTKFSFLSKHNSQCNNTLSFKSKSTPLLTSSQTKFENFSVMNSILNLKTSKTVYKNLGYFSEVFFENGRKQKFFSFLPLDASSSMNSNRKNFIQLMSDSMKDSNFTPTSIKTFGLQNTYDWRPTSTIGFQWFPAVSNINTSGLFLINPLSFFHMKCYNKIMVPEFKNLKFNLIYIDKYQNLLNLSQSQLFKKNLFSTYFLNDSVDSIIDQKQSLKGFVDFLELRSLNKVLKFSRKISNNLDFTLVYNNKFKTNLVTSKQDFIRTQSNSRVIFDLRKIVNTQQKKMFLRFFISNKTNKNKNLVPNLVNFNLLKSLVPFRKFSFLFFVKMSVKYKLEKNPNVNFDLVRFNDFKKKSLISSLNQNLLLKFSPFEKRGILLYDLEFIPQDNYLLKSSYLSNFENQVFNQTSGFSFLSSSQKIEIKPFNFYLANAQGVKKQFSSFQEGLLVIKDSKLKAKPIISSSLEQTGRISTKKKIFKNKPQTHKITNQNFDDFFLLNFKKSTPPELLNSNSFFQQEKVKNLELLSRLQILKYLQSKMFSKLSQKINKGINLENTNSLCTSNKSNSTFFTFIPFLKQEKSSIHFQKKGLPLIIKKLENSRFSKIKPKEVEVNIKPGWVYKFETIQPLFNVHKRIFEPGSVILDTISFSDQKVLTEIIKIQESPFQNYCVDLQTQTQNRNFSITRMQKNVNSRFLKILPKEKSNRIKKVTKPLYLLIRPFQSYQNLNLQDLKTQLYNSTQKTRLTEKDRSYFLYTQYFSQHCNPQKKFFRTLSTFAPIDLNIKSIDLFSFSKSFYEIQKNKMLKFKAKVTTDRNRLKIKEKNLKVSFSLLKFLLNHFGTKSSNKVSKLMIYKPKIFKINYFKRKNFKSTFIPNMFCFVNYPINFYKLNISLNVSNLRALDFSFSKILFNINDSNLYLIQNFSKQSYNKLKINYLNLLICRNQLKHFQDASFLTFPNLKGGPSRIESNLNSNKQNRFVKSSMVKELKNKNIVKSLLSYKKKFQKFVFLSCFLSNYSGLPRFEYVFDQTYSVLGNQKILATSFYKHQYKLSLELNFFNNSFLNLMNVKDKQFLQKQFNKRLFSDSYYLIPESKNSFVFRNQSLKLNPSFSLTSFYSPFEGEVLKDYVDESNLDNLKKSVNINIEHGLLSERQAEKLILTKEDIFRLSLPISKKFCQPLKINLNSVFLLDPNTLKEKFFKQNTTQAILDFLSKDHGNLKMLEEDYFEMFNLQKYTIPRFQTSYRTKHYKVKNLNFYVDTSFIKFRLGNFVKPGTKLYSNTTFLKSGQIIHLNSQKITLRKAEFFSISPKAILHTYNGHSITKNTPVMTLPFETLKTGDIVQGIPKVEQYLEARTTIQGRLFLNSLPVLLHAIYKRYSQKLNFEKAVRQSFLKIQQILVDGVQRVYRSQGVSIADKHLEIIVRQMTSKVKIVYGGQTGFFAGELVELEFIEKINHSLMVKIQYEPVVLGITRSSLEVDSFLSAASFQQTTKVLTKAALEHKKDFLKGLKENLLVGNLLPAGTGYLSPLN